MASKPRTARRWACSLCLTGVTVYSQLPEAPVHPCSKRNGKVCRLELQPASEPA